MRNSIKSKRVSIAEHFLAQNSKFNYDKCNAKYDVEEFKSKVSVWCDLESTKTSLYVPLVVASLPVSSSAADLDSQINSKSDEHVVNHAADTPFEVDTAAFTTFLASNLPKINYNDYNHCNLIVRLMTQKEYFNYINNCLTDYNKFIVLKAALENHFDFKTTSNPSFIFQALTNYYKIRNVTGSTFIDLENSNMRFLDDSKAWLDCLRINCEFEKAWVSLYIEALNFDLDVKYFPKKLITHDFYTNKPSG